jgi:hypothetical protein
MWERSKFSMPQWPFRFASPIIASLLVSKLAPPSPSIGLMSGLPETVRMIRSHNPASSGMSFSIRKISWFTRSSPHDRARKCRSIFFLYVLRIIRLLFLNMRFNRDILFSATLSPHVPAKCNLRKCPVFRAYQNNHIGSDKSLRESS